MRLLVLVSALFLSACASRSVLRDSEYRSSVAAYQRVDPLAALEFFPQNERGGFITSVEKGWLSQWTSAWDPAAMQKQAETFDQRRYVSVSREAGTFLFQESEEGYVPGEHEIVVLHLVSALHFRQKNQPEEAKVELRRAGYVLDRFWDDPALRLWLGTLWSSLGEWPEAQVDFRRAAELSQNPDLMKFAETTKLPGQLTLHFYGSGPLVKWTEGNYEPQFVGEAYRGVPSLARSPTLPWSKRHVLRNTELRSMLLKSNFMAQYLGAKGLTFAETGLVKTTAATVSVVGVALGAAIVAGGIYLFSGLGENGGGSEAMRVIGGLGLGVGSGMWAAGRDLDRELSRDIREHDQKNQEDLRVYRMVRFLPTWLAVSLDSPGDPPNATVLELGRGVSLVNHY